MVIKAINMSNTSNSEGKSDFSNGNSTKGSDATMQSSSADTTTGQQVPSNNAYTGNLTSPLQLSGLPSS